MARTVRTPIDITRDGVQLTYDAVDSANGEQMTNGGRVVLDVVNGGPADIDVTFTWTQSRDGQTAPDRVVTVPDGEDRWIGPFPPNLYGSTLLIDYSDDDTVTACAVKVP